MSNITQAVNADKNLKTLKKGIYASDLDQLLSSTGPFTFLAPSDIAFEKMGNNSMDILLEPANREKLLSLLNNHIISGKILLDEMKDGDELTTLGGTKLKVQVRNGAVQISGILLTPRPARITNGAMHVIDTVMN